MAIGFLTELVPLEHPRFRQVEVGIFTRRIVSNCLDYTCRERQPTRIRLDACCQYGADVDLQERDQILARAADIRSVLTPEAAMADWFLGGSEPDADFPSGARTRTTTLSDGCVFLSHDRRGCGIHRAALANGWSPSGVKPAICRLFPMTWDHDSIGLCDDYVDYTCAFEPTAPTIYRNGRTVLAELFGVDLTRALDQVEFWVLAQVARRLPQVG